MPETSLSAPSAPPAEVEAAPPYSPSFARPLQRPLARLREKFVGFVRDEPSAVLLRERLGPHLPETCQIHVVDFRAALAILGAMTTPEAILVDVTGEDQPINALMELAEVVEPGTVVLAIGEAQTVNFYRTVTRGMGIREYLPKPLTHEAVERDFVPILRSRAPQARAQRAGRSFVVAGAGGGVGASTVAANLAWYIGAYLHRHTVLLDGDLYTGTAALSFNLPINNGLVTALEYPDRIDPLLLERSIVAADERMHVLAGQQALDQDVAYKPGAAADLLAALGARFNFVIADAGCHVTPFARDLLTMAQQRVLVLDPSPHAVRHYRQLTALPFGPGQVPRPITVLNKSGMPGGLGLAQMEELAGICFDVVIPDQPRIVPKAAQYGTPAASVRGGFRTAIAALATALGATAIAEAA